MSSSFSFFAKVQTAKGSDEVRRNRKKNRFFLILTVLGIVTGTAGLGIHEIRASIPDELYVVEGEENALDSIVTNPWISTSDSVTTSSGGKYIIECKLFGTFLIKKVVVSQVVQETVAVSGETIGIYIETDGILVIDTQEILNNQGRNEEPARNLVQPGDYIQKVDGISIEEKSELVSRMKKNTGEPVVLELNRDGNPHNVSVQPVCGQDGAYKLGIWVRDNTQGIGTLTYVTKDGTFGALGHGISDTDMGDLLKLEQGDLYEAEVVSVTKGASGSPGELAGIIHYNEKEHLGKIKINETCGIYGTMDESAPSDEAFRWMEVGYKQEMAEGPAVILCSTNNEVCQYQVEIDEIYWDAAETNKCFVLKVTDPELIGLTGGIVQGMSGAPVIQNGKLVGAVTHVFVDDPTRGYGIFIENMLDAAG